MTGIVCDNRVLIGVKDAVQSLLDQITGVVYYYVSETCVVGPLGPIPYDNGGRLGIATLK